LETPKASTFTKALGFKPYKCTIIDFRQYSISNNFVGFIRNSLLVELAK
jgi:hypothetical protein